MHINTSTFSSIIYDHHILQHS